MFFPFKITSLLIALNIFLCSQFVIAIPMQADTGKAKAILFVGNSLTYTNDLPLLLEEFAKTKGIIVKTTMLAYPNYALEDHFNDGRLQKLLSESHFDFIVVQQGPSSQQEGKTMLLEYGKRLQLLAEKYHSKLAFFMVWPAVSNFDNFDAVILHYTTAAAMTNAILCPVGKAWKDYIMNTLDYSYYGPDMFHPSLKGSKVAAEIIYESLFGEVANSNR